MAQGPKRLTRTPTAEEKAERPWSLVLLRAINADGTLLWPERSNLDFYREIWTSGGSAQFNAVFMQDATGLAGDVFKPEWFQAFVHRDFTEQVRSVTQPGRMITMTAADLLDEGKVQFVLEDLREWVSLEACDLAVKQKETADYYCRCLPPTELVPILASDYLDNPCDNSLVLKQLAHVRPGDRVLTHLGRWQRVDRVYTRDYVGDLVVLKVRGLPETALTPEHPVFCVKNPRRLGYAQLLLPGNKRRRLGAGELGQPQWVPAGEVQPADWVVEAVDRTVEPVERLDMSKWLRPERWTTEKRNRHGQAMAKLLVTEDEIRFSNPKSRPIPRYVPVTPELCRLIGYYMAEGSRHPPTYAVNWTFSDDADEEPYVADVLHALELCFGRTTANVVHQRSITRVALGSMALYDFFGQFGEGAGSRRVPRWIATLPLGLQAEIIKGAWRGDGWEAMPWGHFMYKTLSSEWATSMRGLLHRQDIVPGLKMESAHDPCYILTVTGCHAVKLAELLGIPYRGRGQNHVIDPIVGDYVYRQVRGAELREYAGPVHNLEVEEDESFQAYSFLVHNCNIFTSRHGDLCVEDVYQDRLTETGMVKDMTDAGRRYKAKAIGVESVTFQALVFRMAVRGSHLPFVEMDPQGRDKVIRARPLAARYEAGKVYHRYGSKWRQWCEFQLAAFPGGRHDDAVDALSMAHELAIRYSPGQYRALATLQEEMRREGRLQGGILPSGH